jgi:hypothetical protein
LTQILGQALLKERKKDDTRAKLIPDKFQNPRRGSAAASPSCPLLLSSPLPPLFPLYSDRSETDHLYSDRPPTTPTASANTITFTTTSTDDLICKFGTTTASAPSRRNHNAPASGSSPPPPDPVYNDDDHRRLTDQFHFYFSFGKCLWMHFFL